METFSATICFPSHSSVTNFTAKLSPEPELSLNLTCAARVSPARGLGRSGVAEKNRVEFGGRSYIKVFFTKSSSFSFFVASQKQNREWSKRTKKLPNHRAHPPERKSAISHSARRPLTPRSLAQSAKVAAAATFAVCRLGRSLRFPIGHGLDAVEM